MEVWKQRIMVHHEPFHLQEQVQERGRGKASHHAAQPEPRAGARLGTWHCRRGRHLYHQPDTPPHAACVGELRRSHHTALESAHFLLLDWSRTNLSEIRGSVSQSFVCPPFSSSFPDKSAPGFPSGSCTILSCTFSSSSVG